MILHKLNDNTNVVRIIFDGDDPHDVSCILCVWILAVLIGQNQTRICFVHLKKNQPKFHAVLFFMLESEWKCKLWKGWGTIRWTIIRKSRSSWWKNFRVLFCIKTKHNSHLKWARKYLKTIRIREKAWND